MKKMSKLTRKLLLSALALGLAVVTLTTTTYAWYTSSTTANAGNGAAETSGTTADSSLMISKDGTTFTTSVNLDSVETSLVPLQWVSGVFQDKEGVTVSTNGAWYEFTLYFKATSDQAVPVYISNITITNDADTKEDLPLYDTLVPLTNSAADGLPNDSKYAVDVVSALDMVLTAGQKGQASSTFVSTSYKLDKKGLDPVGFANEETPNANAYYDAFMESTTTSTANSYNNGLNALNRNTVIGTIPAGQILEVTFKIYLNGWDNNCFDACRGQDFTVTLAFSSKDAD